MSKKIFAATSVAALAALAGIALEARSQSAPTTPAPTAPSVETVVLQRTEHVRRHLKRRREAGRIAGGRGWPEAVAARTPPARAKDSVPPIRTAPSATGDSRSEEHDLERESAEHGEAEDHDERESGDDGEERDD